MFRTTSKSERRTMEQLREHYEIEKELATRLRNASRQERHHLYSSVYDELYRRVPHHQQLIQKSSSQETARATSQQIGFLKAFLDQDVTFLEIGAGDCALSFEVAKHVSKVYAVDVSEEITKQITAPQNFMLMLSDGCSIALPSNSVNVAYSNQLMEHLHPDDANEQLRNIFSALVPGGNYVCITPNRLSGPWDISRYFDPLATGFHLKEYSLTELSDLFRTIGFRKVTIHVGARGIYVVVPGLLIRLLEKTLIALPYKFRRAIARSLPIRLLLGIRLVGTK